jgi:hypothetical protein
MGAGTVKVSKIRQDTFCFAPIIYPGYSPTPLKMFRMSKISDFKIPKSNVRLDPKGKSQNDLISEVSNFPDKTLTSTHPKMPRSVTIRAPTTDVTFYKTTEMKTM